MQFPRLRWSDRRFEAFENMNKTNLKKSIIIGRCLYRGIPTPFLLKLCLQTKTPEMIKVLQVGAEVTTCSFGPFDNNYLLIGLDSGFLLVYDVIEMERVASLNLFENEAVTKISYEPTNLIFASSSSG